MRSKFGIQWIGYRIVALKKQQGKAFSTVCIGIGVMVLGLVFLSGCGLIRREERAKTPTEPPPNIVQVGAPTSTETSLPPAAASSPAVANSPVAANPAATPTQAERTPAKASPIETLPPRTAGIAIGIYQPQADTSGAALDRYIAQAGKKPAFAWLPMTWQHADGSYWQFDAQMLDEFRTRGIMPGLTWEPSKGPAQTVGANQPDFSWKQISSGKYDSYITQFAKDAAAYHYPFVLRILHEMDGTWYPWGYKVNGNTNLADFVTSYKHIVDLFRAAGATNVQYVWNPTVVSTVTVQQYGSMFKEAYPGDNYVDWVGLDGYNSKLSDWRSLQDIFEPGYKLITSFTSRPIILFEVGSLDNPQDPTARANWITQGFLTTIPNQFPAIKAVVWFNSKDGAGQDFTLDTQGAVNAWKQVVSSPLYQGSLSK